MVISAVVQCTEGVYPRAEKFKFKYVPSGANIFCRKHIRRIGNYAERQTVHIHLDKCATVTAHTHRNVRNLRNINRRLVPYVSAVERHSLRCNVGETDFSPRCANFCRTATEFYIKIAENKVIFERDCTAYSAFNLNRVYTLFYFSCRVFYYWTVCVKSAGVECNIFPVYRYALRFLTGNEHIVRLKTAENRAAQKHSVHPVVFAYDPRLYTVPVGGRNV